MKTDMKLEQKRGLQRRYFEVTGDKIKVIHKTSSQTKEWTVNIEMIGHDTLISLLDKYAKIDPDLPEDTMMNQLYWLRNRNLITEDEYIRLKKEYKTRKIMN